jgi:hypothetical protein
MEDCTQPLPEMIERMFKRIKQEYRRCLWPFEQCSRPPCRAHSVQNSRVLEMLQRDGHVVMPVHDLEVDTGPKVSFALVSRNKATTFTGLCSDHDSLLFRPIDTMLFDSTNAEHRFLLAYRSVTKGFHATLKRGQSAQDFARDFLEVGPPDPSRVSQSACAARLALYDGYEMYLYWRRLTDSLETKRYDDLRSEVFTFAD